MLVQRPKIPQPRFRESIDPASRDRDGRDGVGWDGTGWDGMGRDGGGGGIVLLGTVEILVRNECFSPPRDQDIKIKGTTERITG